MSFPPPWLESLVDTVSGCMEAQSAMGPLGYRYAEEEGLGELVVYPTPVELVGGALDGEVVMAGFSVDLKALGSFFQRVDELSWCAHDFAAQSSEGAYVSMEGIYQGHRLWMKILTDPPEDEEPGSKVDVSGRR